MSREGCPLWIFCYPVLTLLKSYRNSRIARVLRVPILLILRLSSVTPENRTHFHNHFRHTKLRVKGAVYSYFEDETSWIHSVAGGRISGPITTNDDVDTHFFVVACRKKIFILKKKRCQVPCFYRFFCWRCKRNGVKLVLKTPLNFSTVTTQRTRGKQNVVEFKKKKEK